jgi:hypothetical protein
MPLWYQYGSRLVPDLPQTNTRVVRSVQDRVIRVRAGGLCVEAMWVDYEVESESWGNGEGIGMKSQLSASCCWGNLGGIVASPPG